MTEEKKGKRGGEVNILVLLLGAFFALVSLCACASASSAAGEKTEMNKALLAAYDTEEGFAYGSGDGKSAETAFLVATPAHLDNVRGVNVSEWETGRYFRLIADIDLAGYLAPGGDGYAKWGEKGWQPLRFSLSFEADCFIGVFDGGGHTISGLWINRPDENNVGLFGVAFHSVIKNLSLVLDEKGVAGGCLTGGLVGDFSNDTSDRAGARIEGCSVVGAVRSSTEADGGLVSKAGGVAGNVYGATIRECRAEGSVSGVFCVGGIAGVTMMSDVYDCAYTGRVETAAPRAINGTGGIVGNAMYYSKVARCWFGGRADSARTAAIVGFDSLFYANGEYFIGDEPEPPTISWCYFDASFGGEVTFAQTAAPVSSGAISPESLKGASPAGLEMEKVWGMDGNTPVLRRFTPVAPPPGRKGLWITLAAAGNLLVIAGAAAFAYRRKKSVTRTVTETVTETVFVRPRRRELPDDLTAREREIAGLILAGRTAEEILGALYITKNTLKTHIRNLIRKTECTSTRDFIVKFGLYEETEESETP